MATDAITRAGERPVRLLDDTAVAARHIVRATSSTPGAVQVLPGLWWAPAADPRGIEGLQGWSSAVVEQRLSDHGLLSSMTLPNATGADGTEHKHRFRVRDRERYHLGDEWVEFADARSQRTIDVVTPSSVAVDRASVALTGVDAAGLLSGWREGPVASWTPSAPHDVIDFYSRAPRARLVTRFASTPASMHGWTVSAGSPVATIEGVRLPAGAAIARAEDGTHINNHTGRSIRISLRLDNTTGLTAINVTWSGQALYLRPLPSTSQWGISLTATTGGSTMEFRAAGVSRSARDTLEIGMYVRDGWSIVTLDGQVAAQMRHQLNPYDAGGAVIHASGASPAAVTVRDVIVKTMTPLLRRSAPSADYRLPGAPPPGGLTGDYFLANGEWARAKSEFAPYASFGAMVMPPTAEPYQTRVDPQVSFAIGSTWMPPGTPGGEGFGVRWHGAIYLDLSADRRLRLTLVDDMARLWVGTTIADRPYLSGWGGPAPLTVEPTQTIPQHLGFTASASRSGWYPIVIEFANAGGPAGIKLEQIKTGDPGWSEVPSTQLSPYGCWSGDVAGQSHREIIDTVCQSAGLQWRNVPRSLESGEFPGRLEYAAVGSLGYQSDLVIGEETATEYRSEVDASEACNRVHADAAGLGRADGSDQGLTAEILDPEATLDPWLITRYEQMTDVTEQSLMQQRLDSLLALHGSPHEQVSARPRGTEDLVHEWGDAFPTTSSARMILWEPGDAARLELPSIGVEDRTPRQMATIQKTMRPAGRLPPVVGWRQRPRWLRERLRTLAQQSAAQRRNYQGQLSESQGSLGASTAAAAPDAASRIFVPPGRTVRVVVRALVAPSAGTIRVNGVSTGLAPTRGGEYDVTAWIPPSGGYVYADFTGATGTYVIQLVATVSV